MATPSISAEHGYTLRNVRYYYSHSSQCYGDTSMATPSITPGYGSSSTPPNTTTATLVDVSDSDRKEEIEGNSEEEEDEDPRTSWKAAEEDWEKKIAAYDMALAYWRDEDRKWGEGRLSLEVEIASLKEEIASLKKEARKPNTPTVNSRYKRLTK
ncbi:hypothetical protein L211DRAFT_895982 [Terfezia boudieri ATCC MYA-4762]|uniref:Uncharacterized protein n=1 Tax=Terfezia boudieri ATCC MYA-4762 TaxID=1051890 RepID=A0A3N4LGC3_9PEZI|nr:hypothetical protein L211DRAFT_895982 [Terfezia boudieri ATCC MYA-4762]